MIHRHELMTVQAVAGQLDVSARTVRDLVGRGELPACRLGSGPKARIRVSGADLARFLGDARERQDARLGATTEGRTR